MVDIPLLPSKVGTKGVLTDIDGHRRTFRIVGEIRQEQSTFATDGVGGKVICLQRIRFEHNGTEELRLGYYIIGKKPRMAGKWVWGQYATFMPLADFKNLIAQAREKGWI